MNDRLDFLVYCIESYKNANNLKGKQAIELFSRYNVIKYIDETYESLHTTGMNYIIEDIEIYINNRKKAEKNIKH